MSKNKSQSVLIIECLDPKDPGSEGDFLRHMFKLMQINCDHERINTQKEMLDLLRLSQHQNIHITTHGSLDEKERFTGLWTTDGEFNINHFASLQGKLRSKNIVVTACKAFDGKFNKAFVELTFCSHFIAPRESVSFISSIYFSHIYYHKYFINNKSVSTVYTDYIDIYKNPYKFSLESFESLKRKAKNPN